MTAPLEVKLAAQLRDAIAEAERFESMHEKLLLERDALLLERDALLLAQERRQNVDAELLAETMADAVCAPGESAWPRLSESEKEHWRRAAYVARAAFGANRPASPALQKYIDEVNAKPNAEMTRHSNP